MQNRPPIVVILGHVDHGKTSLLDALQKTNIAARETGGITQATRAFQLKTQNSNLITFIDTPGHAAFSQMRSRGGKIADIAILVVAANDGVMPQTKESITTIQAAKIPMIVAINKSDLPEANQDMVKAQLAENGVVVESYGGDVPSITLSAKTGQGLPELLEIIQLINELNPAQADPEDNLEAIVLESRLDPQKGPVAIVIVKNGSLKTGMSLPLGKIKALTDTTGQKLTVALPATPVEILGLSQIPPVGSIVSDKVTLNTTSIPDNKNKEGGIAIILKADVLGSLEAIQASISPEVNVILAATGEIQESDVLLAQTTRAFIVGFNTKVSSSAAKMADIEKIDIRVYKIIYELLDAVELLLHPASRERIIGKATISAEFKFDNLRVAGCKCTEGEMKKNELVRIVRGEEIIGETRFRSLRLGKNETTLVKAGTEFGAIFGPQIDFQSGDGIICYQIHGSL
jgi:translation initiation factor IF-2